MLNKFIPILGAKVNLLLVLAIIEPSRPFDTPQIALDIEQAKQHLG